jgi:hypothetical protein
MIPFHSDMARPMASYAVVTLLLVALSVPVHAQAEFDEAHSLLQQLSATQLEKRDRDNAARLAELMSSVPQRVEKLLTKGVVELLNTPARHSVDELHQKIAAALQIAPLDQYRPEVFVYSVQAGHNDAYLVAYNIVYCVSCSRGWLGLVERTDNLYHVVSSDDNAFPNRTLDAVVLWPTAEGKPRFLVHGTNWGDAHNRLTVTVYAVDEGRLRILWSLADLPQGNIKVTPTEIIVSYLTALVPPWSERTETYAILPGEIKLRQSTERPNP